MDCVCVYVCVNELCVWKKKEVKTNRDERMAINKQTNKKRSETNEQSISEDTEEREDRRKRRATIAQTIRTYW